MSRDEKYRYAELRMDQYLLENNMRHTSERYLLLNSIVKLGNPFSAEQLLEEANRFGISQGTVYNTLALLTEAKVLIRLNNKHRVKSCEYELITPGNGHIRCICMKCGRVSKAADVVINQRLKSRTFNNFKMMNYSLYVYGECKQCRIPSAKNKTKSKK